MGTIKKKKTSGKIWNSWKENGLLSDEIYCFDFCINNSLLPPYGNESSLSRIFPWFCPTCLSQKVTKQATFSTPFLRSWLTILSYSCLCFLSPVILILMVPLWFLVITSIPSKDLLLLQGCFVLPLFNLKDSRWNYHTFEVGYYKLYKRIFLEHRFHSPLFSSIGWDNSLLRPCGS